MADYTDDDVTRLTEMLGPVVFARHRTVSATYEGGRKFSFSMRWVIGWVLW